MHIQESLLLHLPSEDAGALASGRLQCLLIAAVTQSVSGHIFLTRVYFIKGLINKMVKKNTLSMLSLSPFLYLFQTLKAIRAFVQITVPHINISSVGPLLGIWVPPLKS